MSPRRILILREALTLAFTLALALAFGGMPAPAAAAEGGGQHGIASWYGSHHHGKRMANGKPFDQWGPNAAHRTLPLGTRARVLNLRNGRSAEVVIADRGPYSRGRILDVSRGTARALGFERAGTAPVALSLPR